MNAHRVETVIRQDKTVLLEDLPFQAGESVEVIISHRYAKHKKKEHYTLRGTSIKYVDPTKPVAGGDWNVSQ